MAADTADSKILALESLRGLAAFLVFLHHIPAWEPAIQSLPVLRNAQLMVDLFFVLSGYVIYRSYGERIRGAGDIARFQFLRFGRLYPVHLLVMLGFGLAELSKYLVEQRLGAQFGRPAFEHLTALNVAANLTLTQSLGLFPDLPAINGPSWSVSTEFYTYLLFAFVALCPRPAKIGAFAALAAAAIACLALVDAQTLVRHGNLLRCIAGFFLGCLTALGSERMSRAGLRVPGWTLGLMLALVVALLCFQPTEEKISLAIQPLSVGLILATVHGARGPLLALLNSAPLVMLGTLSYSVYMCHYLILWSVDNVLQHVLRTGPLGTGAALGAYAATIALTLGVSALVYRLIEQPFRQRSRRFLARRGTAPQAG